MSAIGAKRIGPRRNCRWPSMVHLPGMRAPHQVFEYTVSKLCIRKRVHMGVPVFALMAPSRGRDAMELARIVCEQLIA